MAGKSSISGMTQANEDRRCIRQSQDFIPFALADYFEFVDWSGRAIREDKRGAIHIKSASRFAAARH